MKRSQSGSFTSSRMKEASRASNSRSWRRSVSSTAVTGPGMGVSRGVLTAVAGRDYIFPQGRRRGAGLKERGDLHVTSTSSTGPIAFGCMGSFVMAEALFLKRAGALLQELSGRLGSHDDYECR